MLSVLDRHLKLWHVVAGQRLWPWPGSLGMQYGDPGARCRA